MFQEYTQRDLELIVSIFADVFKRKVEILDADGEDVHIAIEPDGFEIWPSVGTRPRLGGTVDVRTWDVFEGVHIPSTDRDTPDDYDSLPRGTFGGASDVVAAVELAIARRDIDGRIQEWGERQMVWELEHVGG